MLKGSQRLSLAACCLLGTAIAFSMAVEMWSHISVVSAVQAQGNTKTVIADAPHLNDPIALVKVASAGKAAVVDAPTADDLRWWPDGGHLTGRTVEWRVAYRLPAGDSWLKTVSFVLRNRTSEKIVKLDVMVLSPQDNMKMLSEFSFGQLPAAVAYYADGKPFPQTREPITFKPGEEMTFALADDQLGLGRLDAEPLPSTSLVHVLFTVFLEDGLSWMEYMWSKPDPEHPGQWLPTAGPYFPPNGLPGPHMKRPAQ